MKPTDLEILQLLKTLVHECQEHNSEYHHMTTPELLNRALQTIDKLEQNVA
jgi:hypothetical protein